jgi:CheY-like chemotaxis protein
VREALTEVNSADREKNHALEILVVDDEPLIRWALRRGLDGRGHKVSEAADAAGALQQLTAAPERFAAILLDYRLPDRQDLSLLIDVRQLSPRAHVFMMTAFADAGMRAQALAAGACAVIDKPFQVRDVIAMIESAGTL